MNRLIQGLLIATLSLSFGQVVGEATDGTPGPAWRAAQRPAAAEISPTPRSVPELALPPADSRTRPRARLRHENFEFPETRALEVTYSGPAALVQQMKSNLAVGTALAAADFDGDGTPDLVVGYSGPAGAAVAMHRGNPDAISPHSPGAMARRAAGTFTDAPFLDPARLFPVDAVPDFLEAGDFDGDGKQDVVVARRGATEFRLLAGDGLGKLTGERTIALPGGVTALASGEFDLRDRRPELAVGITNDDGAAVLVFEARPGALGGEPERFDLQAAVNGLVFDRLDEGVLFDLAVAAGNDVVLISGRDRRLDVREDARGDVAPAEVTTIASLGSTIRSIASGDYLWDDEGGWGDELALLTADGALHLLGRDTAGDWSAIGRREVLGTAATAGDLLVTARVSGLPLEEVILLDRAGKRLAAALGEVHLDGHGPALGRLEAPLVAGLERGPIAALPMRLDRNNVSDLVLLQDGLSAPAVAASVAAILTVTDGAPDLGPAANGLCSLSEAIDNANANGALWADCPAGTGPGDIIDFAIGGGGFPVTIRVGLLVGTVTQGARYTMLDGDTLDGFSQGCAVGPCVGLDGAPLGAPSSGLNLRSSGNVVRGMALHGFSAGVTSRGIQVSGFVTANIVEGNYVGLDVTGASIGNAGEGVFLFDAMANTIGGFGGPPPFPGNVISSNGLSGVWMTESAVGNSGTNDVVFNYIGTDPAGGVAFGNGGFGVNTQPVDGNLIAENLVSGNGSTGIRTVAYAGNPSDGNVIDRNRVGTDVSGTFGIPNGFSGIALDSGTLNLIANNLVSGNFAHGISLFDGGTASPPTGNTVDRNVVGLDVSATLPLGNTGGQGIGLFDARGNFVTNNVSSANGFDGVHIRATIAPGTADGNVVADNVLGLDGVAAGILGLGNTFSGVYVEESSFNDIVGNTSSANGFIGGFGHAVELRGSTLFTPADTASNTIRGNRLGTDTFGVGDLGNFLEGVRISDANDNTVGGTGANDRNIVCGNDFAGVIVANFLGGGATGNVIQQNSVGEDASGVPVPNTIVGIGIQDASGNLVGGPCAGCGNRVIDTGVGVVEVAPFPTLGNKIRRNSIASNAGLGIDLVFDGVTPNDGPLDPDVGPNGLQNFPAVASVFVGISDTVIIGSLDSLAGTSFDTEFFLNGVCDPSGFGEGDVFLGTDTVFTTAAGSAPFTTIFPVAVPLGGPITSTATGPEGTSEFSACAPAVPCPALGAFPQTIVAPNRVSLSWPLAADVKFIEGPLAGVSSYTISGAGALPGAVAIGTGGPPPPGTGRYYAVRDWGCASWQTVVGGEPARDAALP